jgi:hypothetical protein
LVGVDRDGFVHENREAVFVSCRQSRNSRGVLEQSSFVVYSDSFSSLDNEQVNGSSVEGFGRWYGSEGLRNSPGVRFRAARKATKVSKVIILLRDGICIAE